MNLNCYLLNQILLIACPFVGKVLGIIGGTPAESYPFYALVMNGDRKCGGTALIADIVLTAAHCFYNQEKRQWASPIDIYVLYGDFSTPGGWRLKHHSSEFYQVHHNYDPAISTGPFDIALIKLEEELGNGVPFRRNRIKPCCFQMGVGHKYGTTIGLGLTNQNPNRHATQLMEVGMEEDTRCGKHDRETLDRHPELLTCYRGTRLESFMCTGDAGGPIVFKRRKEVVCLIAISSFVGEPCGDPDYPTTFTIIASSGHWIKRRIRDFKDLDRSRRKK